MHTPIFARVGGWLAHLVAVQGNSLWLPRRTLSLTEIYETAFDALDLATPRQRTSAACCGGDSAIAALTR